MRTVKLLSWHEGVAGKAKSLARKGVTVDATPLVRTSRVIGELAEINPAALVLDMDRLPSNCREIALMLRASKSARHIPILFAGSLPPDGAGGLPGKYARLKAELPDIPYAAWPDAGNALRSLLDQPMTAPPLVPPARVYTTSLAQKLGIVATAAKEKDKPRKIALLAAPEGFVNLLGELPETVSFVPGITPGIQLAVCFVRTEDDLAATLDLLVYRLPEVVSAWIAYPKSKKVGTRQSTFSERDIRQRGLAAGLVDYKIASIDATWSGLKFARRKPQRAQAD